MRKPSSMEPIFDFPFLPTWGCHCAIYCFIIEAAPMSISNASFARKMPDAPMSTFEILFLHRSNSDVDMRIFYPTWSQSYLSFSSTLGAAFFDWPGMCVVRIFRLQGSWLFFDRPLRLSAFLATQLVAMVAHLTYKEQAPLPRPAPQKPWFSFFPKIFMDFHWFSLIFIDSYRFSWIFIDFYRF